MPKIALHYYACKVMSKMRLFGSPRKCYWPQAKRKIVEQIRAGIKTREKSLKEYSVALGQLRKWNPDILKFASLSILGQYLLSLC